MASYKIAIRSPGESDWKYIHGEPMVKNDLLWKLFPDFPRDVEFPPTYAKKVTAGNRGDDG